MRFWMKGRTGHSLHKFITILIIHSFLFSNVSLAGAVKDNISADKPQEIITNPEKIVVPREFGLVKSKFTGKDNRLIVHIQDAHCNYEAQANIVNILENLIKNYNLTLISVEGADGLIDTSWFKAFPDEDIRSEVATYFMKKGEITGPEFLSITTDYPIKLFGAETRAYYIENLNAFTSSYPLKDQTEAYYNQIKAALNRIKNYIYNDELKTIDAKMRDYESKTLPFNDYVRFLQGTAERHKINLRTFENFFKLVSVLIYEKKIDFNIVDKERNSLIDELSKLLSKDELTELVNQSLSFKSGKVSSAEYYGWLKNISRKSGVELIDKYPNLFNYIIYNTAYSKIENEHLFNEIRNMETAIKEKVFANDDQRILEKLSRHVEIILGLINIKLLNADFEYYEAHRDEFTHEAFSDFIKKKSIQYGLVYEVDDPSEAVATSIPKLEDFYSIAIKRDKALVDNTLNEMKKEKEIMAVLVTGGFHSEGIAELLEKEGVSYMVICPTITKDVPNNYIKILTNQQSSFDDILLGAGEAKKELLAPYLYTEGRTLRREEPRDIQRELGPLEGRVRKFNDMDSEFAYQYVKSWLSKLEAIKGREGLLRDKGVLLETFIFGVDAHAAQAGGAEARASASGVSKEDREGVIRLAKEALDRIYDVREREVMLAYDGRASAARKSAGSFSMAGRTRMPLSERDFELYDRILEESFKLSERPEGGYKVTKEEMLGLAVQIHGDEFGSFERLIAEYNDNALLNGQPTIPFSRGHPGTWSGRVEAGQTHISRYIWDRLEAGDKTTYVNHEMAHLDIYLQKGKFYALWQLYQKYCKDKKQPIDQEHMIDNARFWAQTLLGWMGEDNEARRWAHDNDISLEFSPGDFPESNVTDVREKITKFQGARVVSDARNALQRADEKDLRIAFVEAYVLASDYSYLYALGFMVNMFAQQVASHPKGEDFYKSIILQIAEWYPLWIRKDLFDNTTAAGKELLEKWFEESVGGKDVDKRNVVAVIMAGGGGERLWPLSVEKNPKQLAEIVDEPLLVMAVERVVHFLGKDNVYIQTVPQLRDHIITLLKEIGIPESNVFAEPKGANTSGAVGYAAAKLKRLGRGDDVMFVCTADHYIDMSTDSFRNAYMDAAKIAKYTPTIGTLGIDPEPIGVSEEYGCIRRGPETYFYMSTGARVAERFIEKPEGQRAIEIFDERDPPTRHHIWLYNSGMYIGRPNMFLEAFRLVAPAYGDAFDAIAASTAEEAEVIERREFDKLADFKARKGFPHSAEPTGFRNGVSIDYVVSEPLSRGETNRLALFLVPGSFKWKDIGGFKSAYEYYRDDYLQISKGAAQQRNIIIRGNATKDRDDNVIVTPDPSNITVENCSGTFILSLDPHVKITLKGLRRALVVYNTSTKTLMVSPIDVKGEEIKALSGLIKTNPDFAGYISADLLKIKDTTADRRNFFLDKRNIVNGNGITRKAKGCDLSVDIGLGVVLGVDNVSLQMRPESPDSSVPNIKIESISKGMPALTSEERIDNTLRMYERTEFDIADLTPQGYREMYGLTDNNIAERETALIKGRIERYEYCRKNVVKVKMGTSGLRGVADKILTDMEVYINFRAQIEYLIDLARRTDLPEGYIMQQIKNGAINRGDVIGIAGDFRPSTPRLLRAVAAAIIKSGCKADFKGMTPTPSVANYGLNAAHIATFMVTGSHNPFKDNGVKTNRPNGELLKPEEPLLKPYIERIRREEYFRTWDESMFNRDGWFKPIDQLDQRGRELFEASEKAVKIAREDPKRWQEKRLSEAEEYYLKRYVDAFVDSKDGEEIRPLEGKDIIFWQHSAVGRTIIPRILRELGANVIAVEPTDGFVPVDTENMAEDTRKKLKAFSVDYERTHDGKKPFAIVSTDGDSDRPVFCDENGEFLHGDKLGALASIFLGLKFVASPISTNSRAIRLMQEKYGITYVSTKIGSPYVIEATLREENREIQENEEVKAKGGFEVNGGFLLWSDLAMPNGNALKALPTRDAVLPIISAMAFAIRENKTVSELIQETFRGYEAYTPAGLVENTEDNVTPGCENYTREIGPAIVKSFSPKDEDVTEVRFVRDGEIAFIAHGREARNTSGLAEYMEGIKGKLEGYLGQITPLKGVKIWKINYLDGVRIYFANSEIVHLRPSGNAAQFRIYSESEELERARTIIDEATKENTGVLVKIIQDFGASPAAQFRRSGGAYSVQARSSASGTQAAQDEFVNRILDVDAIPEAIKTKPSALREFVATRYLEHTSKEDEIVRPLSETERDLVEEISNRIQSRTEQPEVRASDIRQSASGQAGAIKITPGSQYSAERFGQVITTPYAESLTKVLNILRYSPQHADKYVILAYDTALAPEAEDQAAAQAGESRINKEYLGGRLINIRKTGVSLLEEVKKEAENLKQLGRDFVIVTIAGDDTISEIRAKDEKAVSGLGKVINVANPKDEPRMIPVTALYELALRIAYGMDRESIYRILTDIAEKLDSRTGKPVPFAEDDIDELLKGSSFIIKILPKIRPEDTTALHDSYKGEQKALSSV